MSNLACSPSNEYSSETRHLIEFDWDSRIGWATVQGAPKSITPTPTVLPYQSSELPATPKVGRNPFLGSESVLKLTLLSLHSASSHTLLEAPTD